MCTKMLFWGGYFLFSIVLFVFSSYVQEKDKKIIIFFYSFFLWFLASFRYMVGTDYPSYVQLYSLPADCVEDILYSRTEPLFQVLVAFLNLCGFDYQMLFVIIETIIMYYLLKAFKFFLIEDKKVLLALFIYGVFSIGFYWSFNVVRQVVAMSIIMYASRFIFTQSKGKFFFYVFYATLFHYSAILFIFTYWIDKLQITMKRQCIILILCICLAVSGYNAIPLVLLMDIFSEMIGLYRGYIVGIQDIAVSGNVLISYTSIFLIGAYIYISRTFLSTKKWALQG